jgi:AcrR family transcriptional regulator
MNAFMKRGIRAVKMDDIAQQLTISKRTLYEIYEDKEELLYRSIIKYDKLRLERLTQYAEEGHHVIDVILEAYRIKMNEVRTVNPSFYEDIMKYPKVEKYIKEAKKQSRGKFLDFMQLGVNQGLLRKEIDYNMVPHMFDAIGKHIMDNHLLQRYTVEQLFVNFFLVSLRGLCTPQGVKVLDEAVTKIQ